MNKLVIGLAALSLSSGAAMAGRIDHSGQSVAVIFEKGNYAEFSFGLVNPHVSGTAIALAAPGLNSAGSGNMSEGYSQSGAAYKHDLGNGFDAALIFDHPFGANVLYPTSTNYYAEGSKAELKSSALTGVLKYALPSNVSVYAGLRYQIFEAQAKVPFVDKYAVTTENDAGTGYLLGVAYERPEIALRVALSYNSKIEHNLKTTEKTGTFGPDRTSNTAIETPQSVNLEFQSGIAADTLVFGAVRWVNWTSFDITPNDYRLVTKGASIVSYNDDTFSYSLGLGRKFNESWSGAVSIGYEGQSGGFTSNLGPSDGYKSIGLGGTYSRGKMKITGGVRYVWIGDAQTPLPGLAPAANFTDNHAVAVGVKVGYSF